MSDQTRAWEASREVATGARGKTDGERVGARMYAGRIIATYGGGLYDVAILGGRGFTRTVQARTLVPTAFDFMPGDNAAVMLQDSRWFLLTTTGMNVTIDWGVVAD